MRVWICLAMIGLSVLLFVSACASAEPKLNATPTPFPSPAPSTTPQVTPGSFIMFARYESRCLPDETIRIQEQRVWYQAKDMWRREYYDAGGNLIFANVNNTREHWEYATASHIATWSPSQTLQDLPFVALWDIPALQADKHPYVNARFLGEQQFLGRSALRFEINERPEQAWHSRPYCSGYNLATTILVDRATQVQLESKSDTRAQEYHLSEVTRFDVNPPIDAAVFEFVPPPGTQLDTGAKEVMEFLNTIPATWKRLASQLPFALFIPRRVPDGYVAPDAPKYDGNLSHGVVLEYTASHAKSIVLTEWHLTDFVLPKQGEQVKLRSRDGIYQTDGIIQTLSFVRNQTAIELRTESSLSKQQLMDIALSLVSVPKQ